MNRSRCDCAEGFEAGGHNGREETTSLILIPCLNRLLIVPLIAAGGMYNGSSLIAALARELTQYRSEADLLLPKNLQQTKLF